MKEIDLYGVRGKDYAKLHYYFDKITGIFFKGRPKKLNNVKKILLLRNDHIGDMALATPVFKELKQAFPGAKITVLSTSVNKSLIEKDKNVDNIIVGGRFWSKRTWESFKDYLELLRKLRKEEFDIGIDLRRSMLNIFFFLYLPGIKNRISYFNIGGGKAFLTHPVVYNKKTNVIYENVDLLKEGLGIKTHNYLPEIENDDDDKKKVDMFLQENKLKKFIIICPGSTTTAKQWSEKKFGELIEKFHEQYLKHKVIVTSGPGDEDLIERLCKDRNYCLPLIGFNLRRFALLCEKSDVVVANDGGAQAISWIGGGKTILLNGPVDLDIHMPLKKSKIIHHKTKCYPCNWSVPCAKPCGVWCMDLIGVDEVMKAINDFI